MNPDFVKWVEGRYPESSLQLDSWTRVGLQAAYQAGTTHGNKQMEGKILALLASRRDRDPAMQELCNEIEAMD